jgi:hypothetical protein
MGDLRLFVDKAVMHHVFDHGFGGIDGFADVWSGILDDTEPDTKPQRSVKTIYAWLNKGMPTARDTMMRCFGELGIDPVAAVDCSVLQRQFGRLRRIIMLGGGQAGGYRSLFEMLSARTAWPDNGLALTYFDRTWTRFDFTHHATDIRNTYVTIHVEGGDEVPVDWPRAFHIAYRRMENADGLWRPYGTVITRLKEAILIHENGTVQQTSWAGQSRHKVSFRTFFGPGAAEFRLASLHPFTARLDLYDDPDVPLYYPG